MKKTTLIFGTFLISAALTFSAYAQQGNNQKQNQSQQSGMMQQGNMGMMQQGNRPMMQRGMMQGNRPMMQRGMGMMQGGMGMMRGGICPMYGQMGQQSPMRKYMMMVTHLPQMQQQLSLSQEQTEKLIDLQADFQKKLSRHQTAMSQNQQELKSLLDEMAPADQVKQQLQKCANARIEMSMAAYETGRQMKAILTADQKEQLKNMMMQQDGMMQQGGGMMQQGGGMMQQGQGGMMQ